MKGIKTRTRKKVMLVKLSFIKPERADTKWAAPGGGPFMARVET
jgi:hypothetical protein